MGRLALMGNGKKRSVGGGSTTTWDPANKSTHIALSGGNLVATSDATTGTAGEVRSIASLTTAKKYFEVTITNDGGDLSANTSIGFINSAFTIDGSYIGANNNSVGFFPGQGGGSVYLNASVVSTPAPAVMGDIVCVAVDGANARIWFRTNGGVWNNSGGNDPATNTGGIDISALGSGVYAAIEIARINGVLTANFGATAFAFTAPSGFGSL